MTTSLPDLSSQGFDSFVEGYIAAHPESLRRMRAELSARYGAEWSLEQTALLCIRLTSVAQLDGAIRGRVPTHAVTNAALRHLVTAAHRLLGERVALIERDAEVLAECYLRAFVQEQKSELRTLMTPLFEQIYAGNAWISRAQVVAFQRALSTRYPSIEWDAVHLGTLFIVLGVRDTTTNYAALSGPQYVEDVEALGVELFGAEHLERLVRESPALLAGVEIAPSAQP